ncbi:hypothetical protein DFAR_2000006 [Desulfarculales bacterium]
MVIVKASPPEAAIVPTTDLDLKALGQACTLFEVDLPGRLAVALCDHSHSPGLSNRKRRFQM